MFLFLLKLSIVELLIHVIIVFTNKHIKDTFDSVVNKIVIVVTGNKKVWNHIWSMYNYIYF